MTKSWEGEGLMPVENAPDLPTAGAAGPFLSPLHGER
jgi:hypothetical protein